MVRAPELRPTWQTAVLLQAFLDQPDKDHYGFELSKAAELPSGTVYPILSRLEDTGFVFSFWEQIDPAVEGRRPRRYYRLTDDGAIKALALIEEVVRRQKRWLPRSREAPA